MNAIVNRMGTMAPAIQPVSEQIRQRLLAAGRRFHANDNIAEFLKPDELAALQEEVQEKMQEVLRALVIDTDSDHNTQDTAKRVAKMFVREVFSGRYQPPPAVTEFPNVNKVDELMMIGPITVRSACSHHLCPIMGKLWVGVVPNEQEALIGLSKYARLAEWIMNRPQIQEEAVSQLATLLEEKLRPAGLAVLMQADHHCMHWRGVKDADSAMTSTVTRGLFRQDADLRRDFFALARDC